MEQINVKSSEVPKLTISETITERKTVEKEITIPYFFKDQYNNACKLISKDHYLAAKKSKNYWSIQVYPVTGFKDRIATGTEITEAEFEAAVDTALTSIQMLIQGDELTEADDNIQIDQQLYNQY